MGEMQHALQKCIQNLVGIHDCKNSQGRTRPRWLDSITADLNGKCRHIKWNPTARPGESPELGNKFWDYKNW
jgi:hypothetical protein